MIFDKGSPSTSSFGDNRDDIFNCVIFTVLSFRTVIPFVSRTLFSFSSFTNLLSVADVAAAVGDDDNVLAGEGDVPFT